MKNKEKFYITTAIDYVNAAPHIGHAYEKVLADALARWNKVVGKNVFFITGVDENAQKNVSAAEVKGIDVKEFVNHNSGLFLSLCDKLNISYDKFIRTASKKHGEVVHKILKKVIDNGDIYKDNYEGYYCAGCEGYKTEKDLVDGKCPEHNRKPEYMKEEAYFFRLSKYEAKLIKFVENYIIPESKKNEILNRLKDGLKDVCISRKGADWGVDFPGDSGFKVWVWIDALINYVSGAEEKWPADLHVIGKGINWFHSVIWPAILMSAGYELPDKLLVHGYLISGGKKMGKSLGNVIDPLDLLERYGSDSVRYTLLKCNVFDDSDFSEEILVDRHNKELSNKLGNLVSRVSGLIEKNGMEKGEGSLKVDFEKIKGLMENYEVDKALNEIFAFVDICNEYVQEKKPWETKDKKVLYELADAIKKISILLWPFIPKTSERIAEKFGGWEFTLEEFGKELGEVEIKKGDNLFSRI